MVHKSHNFLFGIIIVYSNTLSGQIFKKVTYQYTGILLNRYLLFTILVKIYHFCI